MTNHEVDPHQDTPITVSAERLDIVVSYLLAMLESLNEDVSKQLRVIDNNSGDQLEDVIASEIIRKRRDISSTLSALDSELPRTDGYSWAVYINARHLESRIPEDDPSFASSWLIKLNQEDSTPQAVN